MWKIAICESDETFANELQKRIENFFEQRDFDVEVRRYLDSTSFCQELDKQMNLVFLDTSLNGDEVHALSRTIRKKKPNVRLIYLSGRSEEIFDLFEYLPFWFIRLNRWEEELGAALKKLWSIEYQERSLKIPQRRGHKIVLLDEIIYMESRGHYIRIHCEGNFYQVRKKLSEYVDLLQKYYFIHPSKSFLVNCAYIKSFDEAILLVDGQTLNCSKSRRNEARRIHERYIEEISYDEGS